MTRPFPPIDALVAGLAAGQRGAAHEASMPSRALIGRALTLVESKRPEHRALAEALLEQLPHPATPALRIGITGVPGVGKSTFIDALGIQLTGLGHRVAVLAVDPSSERSGGSILGDKTRMARLAVDPNAFIRPSPTGGTLGGVAARTRESMRVLEGAGFDVILVETVGVGQSETAVRHLTDTFVLLALAGAGDELQGIKRGIMELADVVLVAKSDGDNLRPAHRAAAQLRSALRLLHPHADLPGQGGWAPPVLTISALAPSPADSHLPEAWASVLEHRRHLEAGARLQAVRGEQDVHWLWTLVDEHLRMLTRSSPALAALEAEVRRGQTSPVAAAQRLLRDLAPH